MPSFAASGGGGEGFQGALKLVDGAAAAEDPNKKGGTTFGACEGVVVAGAGAALDDPEGKKAEAVGAADGAVNSKPPAAGFGASLRNGG